MIFSIPLPGKGPFSVPPSQFSWGAASSDQENGSEKRSWASCSAARRCISFICRRGTGTLSTRFREARDEKVPIESEAAPEEQQPPAVKPPEPKPAVVQQDTEQEPAGAQEQTADGTGTELDESATGGEGSPFAGATIDNASFNYPYWFTQAFRKIRSNWRNPVSHQGTLVCVIYFQVIQSGRVINLQIRESSGIDAFDDACLRSVERSAPFPPLPREFREEIIGINLPFKYQPR